MRKPRHFSPTSFALWRSDPTQYYMRYLSNRRFDKEPQSLPMAVGSAFDFLVKEHLNSCLGNKLGVKGELKSTMAGQVEAHNLPAAAVLGAEVFDAYVKSGALEALKREIVSDARFEFGITARFKDGLLIEVVERDAECLIDGLFLNGRPDGFFNTKATFQSMLVAVIHDWKVNGWMSQSKSPDPGYIACHTLDGKVTAPHKDAFVSYYEGVKVNKAQTINREWKTQLSIYSWVLGVPIGTPIVGSIDQVIGPQTKPRVAKHRFLIDETFQRELYEEISAAWEIVNSNHIFRDVDQPFSVARCLALEEQVIDVDPNFNFGDR